jgi:hypothetical protein
MIPIRGFVDPGQGIFTGRDAINGFERAPKSGGPYHIEE